MLQGIRVLDLSRVIAGPYAAALLGDLGADVIKLERPGRGDDMRALRGNGQMSASFAAVNRNKRGIAVDLQAPEGARLAFELARRADVVIENFLPGVAERLGLHALGVGPDPWWDGESHLYKVTREQWLR